MIQGKDFAPSSVSKIPPKIPLPAIAEFHTTTLSERATSAP